jgi:hypothetical protein
MRQNSEIIAPFVAFRNAVTLSEQGVDLQSGEGCGALDKEDLSTLLTQSAPGETIAIDADVLRSIFGHGVHALDERTELEASQFAEEHDCEFILDQLNRRATFTKREHRPSHHAQARQIS